VANGKIKNDKRALRFAQDKFKPIFKDGLFIGLEFSFYLG